MSFSTVQRYYNHGAANRSNELRELRLKQVLEHTSKNKKSFRSYLEDLALLHSQKTCPKCANEMVRRERDKGLEWRCMKYDCKQSVSYLKGTFFEGVKLDMRKIWFLSYMWSRDMWNNQELKFQLQASWNDTLISNSTLADWRSFFMDICSEYMVRNPSKIGGEGRIVEIDETCLSRRKYNKGRWKKYQQWIFGGVDRTNTSKFFLVPVEKRDAKTLLPIIQQYILPGTTVVSDGWAAYFDIKKLPQRYQHFSVNHSVNFVDPDDPKVHTQNVENGWLHFKRGYRKRGGAPKNLLLRYIHEYCWRKEFRGHNSFFHFWDQVAELYPVDIKTPVVSDDEDEEDKSEEVPLSDWASTKDGLDEIMDSPPPSAAPTPAAEELNDEMSRFSFGF